MPGDRAAGVEPGALRNAEYRVDSYSDERGFGGQHFDIFARDHQPASSSWVVCWSDLMMTMFIMFAALYIFQIPKIQFKSVSDMAVQAAPFGTEVAPPQPSAGSILDRIHDQLRDLIARDGLEAVFTVQVVPEKTLHVILTGDLLFEAGGVSLRADVRRSLLAMAEILRTAPHALAVVGHVAPGEPLRVHPSPWELSVARAAEVAGLLMRDGSFPAERMLVVGYGDQRPVSGVDGVSRSGRVELVLSADNPMEPLPGVHEPSRDGFRQWLAASKQEVR